MSSLRGKRIVVTRPLKQAVEFTGWLRAYGAAPIRFPVIEIKPVVDSRHLDAALSNLGSYDWLILTSANGVKAVWDRLYALDLEDGLDQVHIAAIGPKTAAGLRAHGVRADFVPEEYIAEAILPGLGDLKGRRVLLPRADMARSGLPEAIDAAGGLADDIVAYHTIPAQVDLEGLEEIMAGVDMVTFTSSSTVHNFVNLLHSAGLEMDRLPGDPIFACIGPITARTAEEYSLPVRVIAEGYTTAGLVAAIRSHYALPKDDEHELV